MACVVFFRAVNVGGHQRFQPGALARALARFDVVNIGAAGTFVVRQVVNQRDLREAILSHLPFEAELMICPARDVVALAGSDGFHDAPAGTEATRFVTVMAKPCRTKRRLPIVQPAGDEWEVRVIAVSGRFVLSVRRPGPRGVYPNAVVEKQFGVPATTRNWNTLEAICALLEQSKPTGP